jgi:3-methyladenine DNA glycosylase AlkD
MYGVSYTNLGRLRKKIKTDHALALKLWATANHDARILATMIAEPDEAESKMLDAWATDLDNYVLADALAGFAGRTKHRKKKMERWTRSKKEWIGRAGWHLLAKLAGGDKELPDAYLEEYLDTIEKSIHTRKNHVRDAMNTALIAIGMRNSSLEKKALAAAGRIGKVDVDHGETSCKTPDAASYLLKAKARKKKKQ